MFLLEASILGLAGIVVGTFIGLFGVAYLAYVGIYIGDMAATTGSAFAIGTTMYARFVPVTMLSLSVWTLVIILLGALYPGWFAARLEPVDALQSL